MNNESLSLDEALARAKSYSKKGRIKEAIQLYQGILASFPRHKKARKELKSLEKRNSGSPEARLHQDMSELMRLYSEGAAEQALSLANVLAAQYPDQPLPLNIAGALTLEKEDTESAIELFRRAVKLEPAYADAHSNLAFALFKLERFELAREHYEAALSLSPQEADLYYQLGRTHKALGHGDDALKRWRTAIAIDPKHSKAMVALGYLCIDSGQLEEAEKNFLGAIEIDPDLVGALRGLGYSHSKAGRVEDATEYLERALSLDPENSEAMEIRYMLKALSGDSTGAAPGTYVSDLFDSYAANFESVLVGNLEYDTPQFLQTTLARVVPQVSQYSTALDIGCGTGLCGLAFRNVIGLIDGLDISQKMVEVAREKALYRNLWSGDVLDVLESGEEKYQLVIAADVFIYLGNLEPLFSTLGQHMTANAYFTFSTEHTSEGDMSLGNSLRYAHSRAYIERTARNTGFDLVHFETYKLRKESQEWITGGAYILRRP